MTSLSNKTLAELLDSFASPDPTPGGGSASAIAAAIGASLLTMVSGLPSKRATAEDDKQRLAAAGRAIDDVRRRLLTLADRDSEAYETVVSAYRLPKSTDAEKASRLEEIQSGLRTATEVPLTVMRGAVQVLERARDVARLGNPSASSDVGVAIALLQSGCHGAGLNVQINLGQIADAAYAENIRAEAERLEQAAHDLAEGLTQRS